MNPSVTLKLNSDFRRLYARGKSAASPCAVVYCRRNRLGHNRIGYTVSTKLGNAVTRNRIRRRLREIMRLNTWRFKHGYDLIVVARQRAVTVEYRRLESDVIACCEKLALLKEADST